MNPVAEAIHEVPPQKHQILLVEDEMSVASGLQMILSEEGNMAVDLAMTGRNALETFRRKAFDLLVADLRLPDIDGMDVIKQAKHDRPDVGVIVITGYSTVSSAVASMKLGALDYLPKPFTDDEFLAAVRGALSKKVADFKPAERPETPSAVSPETELQLVPEDPEKVDELMSELRQRFAGRSDEVIPMLQMVQERFGFLPENALEEIARMTRRPPASIFGVATFYEQFRLAPVGRHIVRVCRGTACHVKGSDRILTEIEKRFHLAPGRTTENRMFTLETVACFGSCAMAPVVVVHDAVKGRMNPSKACDLLAKIREHDLDPEQEPSGMKQEG